MPRRWCEAGCAARESVFCVRHSRDRRSIPKCERCSIEPCATCAAPARPCSTPCMIVELDSIRRSNRGNCNPFKFEFNAWLAEQGGKAPVHDLDEIVRSRRYHPSVETRLVAADSIKLPPDSVPACQGRQRVRDALREAVATHDGSSAARRARLSDVEQPAAIDRRSQHAGRRQQPGLLADDGQSGDHGADGLHARQHASGGHDVLRTSVRRGTIDQAGVRLRASDEVAARAVVDAAAQRIGRAATER